MEALTVNTKSQRYFERVQIPNFCSIVPRNILILKDHISLFFILRYYHTNYSGYSNRKLSHVADFRRTYWPDVCQLLTESYLKRHICLLLKIVKSSGMLHIAMSAFCTFLFLPEENESLFLTSLPSVSICGNTECPSLPLKQEEVDIIVALGEEVSKDSCWVATTDLVGRQPKVNTFHKVPKLSNQVLAELPKM